MKTAAIICEYNPFHNGHLYHINRTRQLTGADTVVCLMSGDFVQRGEPALLDKWARARGACEAGADLVIELPAVFACNSAECFAAGAVRIIDGLGCIDYLSFGSEKGDLKTLIRVSEITSGSNQAFEDSVSKKLSEGKNYPRAMEEALAETGGSELAGIMSGANNVLAVNYLRQLKVAESCIQPFTVQRRGEGYNSLSLELEYPSASGLRRMLREGQADNMKQYVPETAVSVLEEEKEHILPCFEDAVEKMIFAALINTEAEELDKLASAGEGLGFKIKKELRRSASFNELIDNVRGSRYTTARIKRIMMQSLLGIHRKAYEEAAEHPYARILAFSGQGAALLKKIKKEECSRIKIINNINREDLSGIEDTLKIDIKASDMYNLISEKNLYENSDYVRHPFVKKNRRGRE